MLLSGYGWGGDVGDVLTAAGEGARQHAVGLRQAAVAGSEPAIERVALGVAADFDRAVADLADDVRHLDGPGVATALS